MSIPIPHRASSDLLIYPIKFTEKSPNVALNSHLWLSVWFFFVFLFVSLRLFSCCRHTGESGLGKATLVNSLFLTDLYPERHILTGQGSISFCVDLFLFFNLTD